MDNKKNKAGNNDVAQRYDYSRLTMNFKNDDEEQSKALEYLKALANKKIDFIVTLVNNFAKENGIEDPKEFAKFVRKGKIFNEKKVFSEEQIRVIRVLISEYVSGLNLVQNEQLLKSDNKAKSTKTHDERLENGVEREQTAEELDIMSDFMSDFT